MTDQPTPRAPEAQARAEAIRILNIWDRESVEPAEDCLDVLLAGPLRLAAPEPTAPGEGDAKLAGNSAPDDLTEWECPNCGATTRARMADHPTAPDDLQREIGQALETARCAHHASDACYDCEAAAVMDVLRRRGLVT